MPLKKEEVDKSFLVTSDSAESDSSLSEQSPILKNIKSKMSEKITLSILTKFIKPYQGDRESLPAFLTNCENAMSLASKEQQNVLCKYILSQLEGKAQVASALKTFESWFEIKQFLKSTFGEKKHSTHLLVDLQNCKQLPSEDVVQYSLRIESCLTRLQSDIQYSCENKAELTGRIAAMEDLALNTFLLGLNSSFSHIVRCRNPKSLSEAITHATEEEKLFNLSKVSSRPSKHCSVCNKGGHVAAECYRNKNRNSTPNSHHLNGQNVNQNNSSDQHKHNSNYDPNKQCAYCKNRGHLINECRKLKYKNNMRIDVRNRTPPNAISSDLNNDASNNNNHSNIHVVANSKDDIDSLN